MTTPLPVAVRHATSRDIPGLVALEGTTFATDRIPRAQWRRHVRSTSASVLVIGAAQEIKGAAVAFYRHNSLSARLYSLAVAADARGTGVGRTLLTAAEADARARGCDTMRLEVRIDNPAAIALYERAGYHRRARLPRFYEDGSDAWRYRKSLSGTAAAGAIRDRLPTSQARM